MDPEKLEHYRITIQELIEQLEASEAYLAGETEAIAPSVAIGRLSRMEAINEKSISEENRRQNALRLERLKNALLRIDAGTYGLCISCKKPIPEGRLEAVPEALKCVPCADKKK